MQTAHATLTEAVASLWSSIGELAIIVHEDQPAAEGLAAAESLGEEVGDLQGAVAGAIELLAEPALFQGQAASVAQQIDAARARYWSELRAAEPVLARRQAARRAGGNWPAWLHIVEQSARRCEEPIAAVDTALNTCWHEMSQLITRVESQPVVAVPLDRSDNTRRMS